MAQAKYVKAQRIDLRTDAECNESWVQAKIAEDPGILGLGDLILKDQERLQPGAGRLDLLFQDAELNQRYEVEIQLGRTDESHIIRTIEYWDIERKRYPQYDHFAVIVAEDITSRFLNVISLFNGFIPLIAVQMNAMRVGDMVTLVCTTVLNQRMLVAEDEGDEPATDRAYWEKRGAPATVKLADEMLQIIKTFDPAFEPKYNKFYIGIAKDGQPSNFVIFRAQKTVLRIEPRIPRDEQIEEKLQAAGIEVLEYNARDGRYGIRLTKADIEKHKDLLTEILRQAYATWIE